MIDLFSPLAASLAIVAAALLIPLVLAQVLLTAYRGPQIHAWPRWWRISTSVLLIVFGAGVFLRVLELLNR